MGEPPADALGPYETEPHLTVSTFTELADELGV